MAKWRKIKGTIRDGLIYTETGHKIVFKPNVNVFVDLDKEEDGHPFFFVEFPFEYIKTESFTNEPMNIKEISEMTSIRKLEEYWKAVDREGY